MERPLSRAPPSARHDADIQGGKGQIRTRRTPLSSVIRLAALIVIMIAVFGFLPDQAAEAQAVCKDYVTGLGTIKSPIGTGNAGFGFAVGYYTPTSRLRGAMAVLDWTGGFFMKTLTVDAYNGYHCVGPNGICADRIWGGDAQVVWPGFSGVVPYQVEVIDWGPGTSPMDDYIHVTAFGYIAVGLINRGNIVIHNQDIQPGCE